MVDRGTRLVFLRIQKWMLQWPRIMKEVKTIWTGSWFNSLVKLNEDKFHVPHASHTRNAKQPSSHKPSPLTSYWINTWRKWKHQFNTATISSLYGKLILKWRKYLLYHSHSLPISGMPFCTVFLSSLMDLMQITLWICLNSIQFPLFPSELSLHCSFLSFTGIFVCI